MSLYLIVYMGNIFKAYQLMDTRLFIRLMLLVEYTIDTSKINQEYILRILLHNVVSPISFENLRTGNTGTSSLPTQ